MNPYAKGNEREPEWYEIPAEKLTKMEKKIVDSLITILNSQIKNGNDFYDRKAEADAEAKAIAESSEKR